MDLDGLGRLERRGLVEALPAGERLLGAVGGALGGALRGSGRPSG
jgi:hypothetical protein